MDAGASQGEDTREGAVPPGGHDVRILVAEDERKVASFIRQGLAEEGHTVEVASDGESALDLIVEGPPYDLVVLDLMLPRLDGFAILKAARQRHVTTPVLVLTARDSIADIGADMSRLGSAKRLSSWAGMAPGNNERAGKRRKGRTRKGQRSLRRVVVPCAWAARKTPTCIGRTLRRFASRLGRKKAAMAVAHTILVIIYHVLIDGTFYDQYLRQLDRVDCMVHPP